ncbi:MAG: hypothetical protein ACQZ3N_05110 [cyanobacterium endosymbiont of Rhopalodia yunnanensis]
MTAVQPELMIHGSASFLTDQESLESTIDDVVLVDYQHSLK